MPIYEYKCSKCDTTFEELVPSEQKKPLPCPSCSSEDTKKIMSAAGISMSSTGEPACASGCPSPTSCGGGTCPMH